MTTDKCDTYHVFPAAKNSLLIESTDMP